MACADISGEWRLCYNRACPCRIRATKELLRHLACAWQAEAYPLLYATVVLQVETKHGMTRCFLYPATGHVDEASTPIIKQESGC